ncbi:MAG: 50S ribosomal protein L33 [Bacilli bacterium]|nr:50S ribosomal protein L33 [Bacilli bacterium]MCH4202441.1 50S ribosomal protein L33 [Bacilli bacterium]MCH4235474.1 50S ribosomal protein L33 [Bacilli bacterium]HML99752.1 50S ribosomal protein L33 [Bacilli bacterium]
MREKVLLICSECLSRNYTTTRRKDASVTERLELKKFCPKCNKMTIHKESR